MGAKSIKWKKENAFFLSENGKTALNKLCLKCTNDCKQSWKAQIVACPIFAKKE